MKQITLKEAFDSAIKGPIKPERQKNNLTGLFGGLGGSHHIAEMSANKETAALLAHCYNNLEEVVEMLATILATPRRIERGIMKGKFDVGAIDHETMKRAMDAISKANQVTIH